ncbi:NUDIX hydrolase [Vulcaniibacterium gelatinicum]|uniref:NUDIX hydrolase n=1 Tax=Vulcaniibacterium gelatinicum TaxID=2598725 RepID=UPI0011C809CC|nr:NUDIX hydrolase [Vulcaniibacterium gelatinicum]
MSPRTAATDAALRRALFDYARRWPEETVVGAFLALLDDPEDPFRRERRQGHFTASAWLVSGDGRRLLMTHHRKLDRWLQLGGHADGDPDLPRVALREAAEESGLRGLALEDEAIFDLDRHWIPARGEVPAHWHYDVRYVVRAHGGEDYVVGDESHDLAWRGIAALAEDADADPSVRRMARKWAARVSPRAPCTLRSSC